MDFLFHLGLAFWGVCIRSHSYNKLAILMFPQLPQPQQALLSQVNTQTHHLLDTIYFLCRQKASTVHSFWSHCGSPWHAVSVCYWEHKYQHQSLVNPELMTFKLLFIDDIDVRISSCRVVSSHHSTCLLNTASVPCLFQPPVALPTSLSLSNPQQTAQITVSYPTPRSSHQQQSQPQKQRVFTGVVNKLHDTFGFVDEDVFFQLRLVTRE